MQRGIHCARHGGVARAGSVHHGKRAACPSDDAPLCILVMKPFGPKRDKQPPHALLQQHLAAAAQARLGVCRDIRQRLQLHAVGLDGIKAPNDAAQPLRLRTGDSVQKHGHTGRLAQRLQRAGLKVRIRHTNTAGIYLFRHAADVLGAHSSQHVHIAHADEHVVRIIHNRDIAAGARALAHQHAGGIHARLPAARKQHLAKGVAAHRAGKHHRHAQTGEVVADVAAHAAKRKVKRTGV